MKVNLRITTRDTGIGCTLGKRTRRLSGHSCDRAWPAVASEVVRAQQRPSEGALCTHSCTGPAARGTGRASAPAFPGPGAARKWRVGEVTAAVGARGRCGHEQPPAGDPRAAEAPPPAPGAAGRAGGSGVSGAGAWGRLCAGRGRAGRGVTVCSRCTAGGRERGQHRRRAQQQGWAAGDRGDQGDLQVGVGAEWLCKTGGSIGVQARGMRWGNCTRGKKIQ